MTGGLPRRILFEKESEHFKQLTHHSSIHSKQSEREQTARSTKNFSLKMPFRRALWAVEILILLAKLNSSRGSKDLLRISLMHCFFSYSEKEPSHRSAWRLARLQIQSCRVQESQTGKAVLLYTSFEGKDTSGEPVFVNKLGNFGDIEELKQQDEERTKGGEEPVNRVISHPSCALRLSYPHRSSGIPHSYRINLSRLHLGKYSIHLSPPKFGDGA